MFRRSPSRIQKSKGFRLKHGIQIFLLLAICMWLLYQVKHSHDKKKAFDESSMKLSRNDQEITKLGRKDLHPRLEEKAFENETHDTNEVIEGDDEENKPEEEEEENKPDEEENKSEEQEEERGKHGEEEEEEKNKHDVEEEEEEENNKHDGEEEEAEAEEEEENKSEESEEERRGAGDDEIDEQDQEKAEEEPNGEDILDKEEKVAKEETKEGEIEENVGKTENVGSTDDQEHDRNTQEAREENYKRDDASSAVVRESQVIIPEVESGNLVDSGEKESVHNTEENKLELDTKTNSSENISIDQNNPGQSMVDNAQLESNPAVNVTINEENGNIGFLTNSTVTKSDGSPEVTNGTAVEDVHTHSSVLQNGTDISSGATQYQIHEVVTADGGESKLQAGNETENSNITAATEKSVSNTTVENTDIVNGEFSGTSNNTDTVPLEVQAGNSNSTASEENSSGGQNETTDVIEEVDESKAASTTDENADVIQSTTDESQNHIITQEEKEDLTDLGTLPGQETEGLNSKDAAVE